MDLSSAFKTDTKILLFFPSLTFFINFFIEVVDNGARLYYVAAGFFLIYWN